MNVSLPMKRFWLDGKPVGKADRMRSGVIVWQYDEPEWSDTREVENRVPPVVDLGQLKGRVGLDWTINQRWPLAQHVRTNRRFYAGQDVRVRVPTTHEGLSGWLLSGPGGFRLVADESYDRAPGRPQTEGEFMADLREGG